MKKIWIYAIAALAVLVVVGIYFAMQSPAQGNATPNGPNTFSGRIVAGDTSPQTYTNVSVLTDEGCTTDPRTSLSNCTSKMQTKNGIIAFNYEHDMMMKPCLSVGDKVDIQVSADGSAVVDRTYWAGGGA